MQLSEPPTVSMYDVQQTVCLEDVLMCLTAHVDLWGVFVCV